MSEFEDRRSRADPAELIADPLERAKREAENGIRQFKEGLSVIRCHTGEAGKPFQLNQTLILELHLAGLIGVHALAGTYRNTPVTIGKSGHVPPKHTEIPDLVADMCRWVNDRWDDFEAIELAAYVLWRLNWIHPFADGNGRTARIIAYVVLSTKLGYVLPGSPTIPEQIAEDKAPYYTSLEEADDSWKREIVALSGMEAMIERMLERQLEGASRPEQGRTESGGS